MDEDLVAFAERERVHLVAEHTLPIDHAEHVRPQLSSLENEVLFQLRNPVERGPQSFGQRPPLRLDPRFPRRHLQDRRQKELHRGSRGRHSTTAAVTE